jgi:hypothetical protein
MKQHKGIKGAWSDYAINIIGELEKEWVFTLFFGKLVELSVYICYY